MPKMLNMPKLGVNMTEALIVEWLVKEGDSIKVGDHILDAETDKAIQEICSSMTGVIAKILVPVGVTVLCQTPIAVLLEPGEKSDIAAVDALSSGMPAVKADARDAGTGAAAKKDRLDLEEAPTPSIIQRKKISPLAKVIAARLGVDWKVLSPAKPGDRIVKADVLAFAAASGAQAPADHPRVQVPIKHSVSPVHGSVLPYAGIRRVIGDRMAESAHTIPSVALTLHADVERLIAWREDLKDKGLAASFNEMMAMIVAKALREHPIMNSTLVGEEIRLLGDINIGIAVDTDRGLFVPVIRNADAKGLIQIGQELRSKVEAAKAGRAGTEDLSGGTFTITNLGMYEIEHFVPIINSPECAILGLGAMRRDPVVREQDRIDIISRMQLTLVFDHRIVDGAPAARFLQRIKRLVEQPMDILS
ncbi:MAG: dihydrolipoamide acetyltransferase family protein [Spirochaetota bacterium]